MLSAIELRRREKKEALQLAKEYVHKLSKRVGPLSAFVYGSFARGDFNAGSDIDVVVVSDSLPDNIFKRLDLLYAYVSGGIEPKGYTTEEFLKLVSCGNPLAIDVIKNGILMHDDNFLKELRKSC